MTFRNRIKQTAGTFETLDCKNRSIRIFISQSKRMHFDHGIFVNVFLRLLKHSQDRFKSNDSGMRKDLTKLNTVFALMGSGVYYYARWLYIFRHELLSLQGVKCILPKNIPNMLNRFI